MDIIVFDDDTFFCQNLVTKVQDICQEQAHQDITVHGYTSYDACAEGIAQHKPSVVFLDIVDGHDEDAGFRLAKTFRKASAYGHIIFVTNYVHKQGLALRDLIRPSGFLAKPVIEPELRRLLENIAFVYTDETTLLVKTGGRSERFLVDDIIYVERVHRKLALYTLARCCEIPGTIEAILQELSSRSPHFLQVDRGVIVNLRHVQCAQYGKKRMLLMSNDALVNVAESRVPELKQKMATYSK